MGSAPVRANPAPLAIAARRHPVRQREAAVQARRLLLQLARDSHDRRVFDKQRSHVRHQQGAASLRESAARVPP
jgi:hypothetical protein